ncbi:MAG: 4-(cytidine 5'-diphospho)-2-C-methyl-D-erythritol kinase [Calditrichaeota bacterium]|nr:4-(cytidine 5'-diphospho)-2-C-methyl-D-erythritol kinase [Calditrichota bacterium]
MEKLALKAYAKINIGLSVTSRRPDGYHEIETIFQQIDLFDEIILQAARPGQTLIETEHPSVPTGERNICYRAVENLREAAGLNFGVKIVIRKNVPIGAGLGGGSSDAAAMIVGTNKLFQLTLSDARQREIARGLGADVPFFLLGGAALAKGIGDELQPIKLPNKFFGVLIYPNVEISTSWVYKNFNFSLTKTKKIIKLASLYKNVERYREFFQNDLEKVVFDKYPELANLKRLLYQKGAYFASMSGSGSSIFGLFKDFSAAENAKANLDQRYQTFLIQPLEKTSITRGAM